MSINNCAFDHIGDKDAKKQHKKQNKGGGGTMDMEEI